MTDPQQPYSKSRRQRRQRRKPPSPGQPPGGRSQRRVVRLPQNPPPAAPGMFGDMVDPSRHVRRPPRSGAAWPPQPKASLLPNMPKPLVYGIRLLIIGLGVAAIAGTVLSVLTPADEQVAGTAAETRSAVTAYSILIPSLKNPEASYYGSPKGYPAKQRAAGKAIEVDVISVSTGPLNNSLAAPGEVIAQEQVEVRSAVEGIVQNVYVEEGDSIAEGQLLMELDPEQLEHNVRIAQLNLATAKANLDAVKKSIESNFITLRNKLQNSQDQLENARAAYTQVSELISSLQVNDLQSLKVQLEIARDRLDSMSQLAEQGAVSQLQLQDAEANFAEIQRNYFKIESGDLAQQTNLQRAQDSILSIETNVREVRQAMARANKLEKIREDKARLTVENREILLNEAIRALEQTQIHASISGLVTEIDVDKGEFIVPNSDSPAIVIDQNLAFRAYIDQTRLNEIQVGDSVMIRLASFSGQPSAGEVIRVNPAIETEDFIPGRVGIDRQYTYSVWVKVADLELSPGLQGYLHFEEEKTEMIVPESAVVHLSGGEGMVMVVEEDTAVVRSVILGALDDNQRKVISGLSPGEVIIANPNGLNPGDKVKPISTNASKE